MVHIIDSQCLSIRLQKIACTPMKDYYCVVIFFEKDIEKKNLQFLLDYSAFSQLQEKTETCQVSEKKTQLTRV